MLAALPDMFWADIRLTDSQLLHSSVVEEYARPSFGQQPDSGSEEERRWLR